VVQLKDCRKTYGETPRVEVIASRV